MRSRPDRRGPGSDEFAVWTNQDLVEVPRRLEIDLFLQCLVERVRVLPPNGSDVRHWNIEVEVHFKEVFHFFWGSKFLSKILRGEGKDNKTVTALLVVQRLKLVVMARERAPGCRVRDEYGAPAPVFYRERSAIDRGESPCKGLFCIGRRGQESECCYK